MNKTEEILKLKQLLDKGLINQSDFERLKKQIFDEVDNVKPDVNLSNVSEIISNTKEQNINEIDVKKCQQCGAVNNVNDDKCNVCKSDLISYKRTQDNYEEPSVNNLSRYFLIIVTSIILFGILYIINKNVFPNTAEPADEVETSINDSITNQNTLNSGQEVKDTIDNSIPESLSSFIGNWNVDENNSIFNLNINIDDNKEITVRYINGGPFEEYYTGKINKDDELELYFKDVSGSISFNENKDVNLFEECRKTLFATCKINNLGKLEVTTFFNNCSEMTKNYHIVLSKNSD